jgi:hypothetical protein
MKRRQRQHLTLAERAGTQAVITIGLDTITWPETVAIVKLGRQAGQVVNAIEHKPSITYPATSLQN